MSSPKEMAQEVLASLPDDCTLDEIHYRLWAREQIQRGLDDIEAGRVVSHEEAKQRMRSWQKSSGPTNP